MSIQISKNLELPDNAVTQTFAFLARRGAGKSYGAMKLAEGMLSTKAQIVAIDPIGIWWSLRLAADGKRAGFDIPVFGGLHSDFPLEPGAGPFIADLLVERAASAVLDLSMFRKGDRKRFATEFSEQFFHLKKSHRSPVHLFIEEAQVFVPQRVQAAEARMLGAFEDIIKLGRNFGIGATLISQRPQAVNKDALNQTEALFVLQTNGAQERKALSEWIVEHGIATRELVDELPSLPIGTAYLWSPSWLRKLEKVSIGKRVTYDASSTPVAGVERVEPRPLSSAEANQIKSAMAATIERAKAEDPKTLKAEIVKLKAELAKRPTEKVVETVTEHVEVPVLSDAERKSLEHIQATLASFAERLSTPLGALDLALAKVIAVQAKSVPTVPVPRPVAPRPVVVERSRVERPTTDGVAIGKGERATLAVVAQYPNGASRELLTVMTGYKRSSRDAYIQRLRTAGYVDVRGSAIVPTQEGIDALGGDYEPLPTGEELRAHWLGKLPEGERAVLSVLFEAYPNAVERAEIDNVTGYKRSSRDAYIQRLKQRLLVDVTGGGVKANDDLFL